MLNADAHSQCTRGRGGLKSVSEVRETSDDILLSFNVCRKNSVAHLCEAWYLALNGWRQAVVRISEMGNRSNWAT